MDEEQRPSPRHLWVLYAAAVGWAFSFGLGAPLASLVLRDEGASDTVIGLNTGTYYLGIALAAGIAPYLMRKWGRGCAVVGMVISGISVASFPWSGGMVGWFGLRWANGVAAALSLIPMETYVNRFSTEGQRARNFGYYAFGIAFGWALGNLIGLQLYSEFRALAFTLGGLASMAAAGVVLRGLPWPREPETPPSGEARLAWRPSLFSFGSAWSQGFLEGGMVAFLPVYLLFLGMPEGRMSWLTSGIMIGVILFQVPVAWMADRLGRKWVLVGCYGLTATSLGFLPFCGDSSWLVIWLFLAGACSGSFYPLGLAILGERVEAAGLARATAWYLAINCCGSLIGPVITGVTMDQFGKSAMFLAGSAALATVILSLLGVRAWDYWFARNREVSPAATVETRAAA